MNIKTWSVAAALLSAGMAHATCFSVYKADGTIIQETSTSPVDLTQPIGDTIPLKFGAGATMTISASAFYCNDRGVPVAGAPQSLAQMVQAEEEKKMVLKAPAATVEKVAKAAVVKEDAAKPVLVKDDGATTEMVKQDGTKTTVVTQKGTVLKMKTKETP